MAKPAHELELAAMRRLRRLLQPLTPSARARVLQWGAEMIAETPQNGDSTQPIEAQAPLPIEQPVVTA